MIIVQVFENVRYFLISYFLKVGFRFSLDPNPLGKKPESTRFVPLLQGLDVVHLTVALRYLLTDRDLPGRKYSMVFTINKIRKAAKKLFFLTGPAFTPSFPLLVVRPLKKELFLRLS